MIHRFQKKTHLLHQTASGMPFEIDVWEYSPPGAKRITYLQGGLHGVELTGIPVLMRFMKELEEHQPNEQNYASIRQRQSAGRVRSSLG